MLNSLGQLFDCLTTVQKKRLMYLQALIIVMSIFEVTSIALIAPFLSYVISDGKDLGVLELVKNLFIVDSNDQIFSLGIAILIILLTSTVISIITTYLLAMYSATTGAELSDRLFKYYCDQDLLFHNDKNSSSITKNLSTETLRMTDLVINPIMQMNAKVVLCLSILGFIVLINPSVALVGVSLFAIAYGMIYLLVKTRLDVNGRELTDVIGHRFFIINECFGGIKEVILSNKSEFYHEKYTKQGKLYAKARGNNHAISLAPRYLVEFITYGAIVSLILVYQVFFPNELQSFISLITVYAIASLKLLPALQHIFTSITQIRGNLSSFSHLKEDLLASIAERTSTTGYELKSFECLELEVVSFKYPTKDNYAVRDIDLKIAKNECVAFVGASGSGKSTLANVLLGLLTPTSGRVSINGRAHGFEFCNNRNSVIGYVPQSIYLTDNTILENIGFGVAEDDIDVGRVKTVVKSANLGNFIESLDHGLETYVGERGVQISGGQKQRIGIARALYSDPEILIFDEATSALDGNSEKTILQSINTVLHKKTIIMIAHRLNTVKNCDTIYVMDKGKIVASGSYNDLMESSEIFQGMVRNA
jgi:HlyD family secretion protein